VELNQRRADFQARVRNSQDLVFVRFLHERHETVGHGWVNGNRDPTTTSTRRGTDAASGDRAPEAAQRRVAYATRQFVEDPDAPDCAASASWTAPRCAGSG
jgi:hypothetical protein